MFSSRALKALLLRIRGTFVCIPSNIFSDLFTKSLVRHLFLVFIRICFIEWKKHGLANWDFDLIEFSVQSEIILFDNNQVCNLKSFYLTIIISMNMPGKQTFKHFIIVDCTWLKSKLPTIRKVACQWNSDSFETSHLAYEYASTRVFEERVLPVIGEVLCSHSQASIAFLSNTCAVKFWSQHEEIKTMQNIKPKQIAQRFSSSYTANFVYELQ